MPDSLTNKIIAGGTILLGIVGIGSLWLTYCSIRQTADAVAAAKAAANAAQAANELTLENISPHIYQTDFSLQPLKIGESPTVKVTLRNTGNEPAENYGIGGIVEIRPNRPINVNLTSGALGEFPPSVTRVSSFAAKSPLTMEQLNGIKNGTLTLYFYGAYRYASPRAGRPDIVVGFCARHTAQTIENGMDACGGYPPDVSLNGFPLQRTPKVQGVPRKYLGQD